MPTITLAKGSACNDNTNTPCRYDGAGGGVPCTNDSCARIRFDSTWLGAPNTMSCGFYDSNSPGSAYLTRNVQTNRTYEPGPYYGYPARSVWVICDGMVESNHLNWY